MKIRNCILFIFLFSFQLSGYTQTNPKIEFLKTIHDYGTIKEEDGPVKSSFLFINKGNANLRLKDVRPSCGCTAANWTNEPIVPGDTGFVSTVFNPQNRPGIFNKGITVMTNDPSHPRMVLVIKGKVEPRPKTILDYYPTEIGQLRFYSNHLAFMDIYFGETDTDTLNIYNNSDQDMSLAFKDIPSHLSVKAIPEILKAKEEGVIIITYDTRKKNDWGLNFDRFVLVTNDSIQPTKILNVSAIVQEDFSGLSDKDLEKAPKIVFENDRFRFGQKKQNEKLEYTFRFSNEGKRDLIIRKIKASCGCTAVEPEKMTLKKGEKSNIKIVFNTVGQRTGAQHKTITVITNDPQNPTTKLHIQGTLMQ